MVDLQGEWTDTMNEKLLIIDDDVTMVKMLATRLSSRGYDVYAAHTGSEGLKKAYKYHPDLIILDIMMPEMDGYETCKRLRQLSDVPILFVSALTEEDDLIKAFRSGGDDYVRKPFGLAELEERVSVSLRRSRHSDVMSESYNDGRLKINVIKQQVYLKGQVVHLTPTEFKLFRYLVENPRKVVTHEELLKQVWGPYYDDAEACVSLYIHYLRDKIEDNPREPRYIRTKWGVGYWFEPQD
jgi:two-component system KDP operon response regulator KdpE